MATAHSATLQVNEQIAARVAQGRRVLHLGFGEAGLPVPTDVADALRAAASANSYGPVAGSPAVRAAVAGYLTRRDLPTDAAQTIVAPGSKPLLFALMAALPGGVVLPRPSWVSYAAQATLAGKRVHHVPVPEEAGGVPDPRALDALLRGLPEGERPSTVVLTLPDNPTGTTAGGMLVKAVVAVADEFDLTIVSDEIYRDLAYDPESHVSPAHLRPDRTVVTGGLSKNMALGGWRVGFARTPDTAWGHAVHRDLVGIASEVWSSPPAPLQAAAAYVFDEPESVRSHIEAGRNLHRAVSRAVHQVFVDAGAIVRPPSAAFYTYPDFEPVRAELARQGIADGTDLATVLLDRHGVGVLAGAAFGDDPVALRFRAASSLLYGPDDEHRLESLHSTDPVALPWIAASLDTLRTALADLTRAPAEAS